MATVFISHSTSDEDLARQVGAALERGGFDMWLDEHRVSPGESWAESISDALQHADAYIVLVTKQLPTSSWATVEVGAALASEKPVIPVLAEDGAVVPFVLRDRAYLDMRDPDTRSRDLDELAHLVSNAIQRRDTPNLRPGIELVDTAREALGHERTNYETGTDRMRRRAMLGDAIAAVSGVAATLVAVAVSHGSAAPIASGIAAGIIVSVAVLMLLRTIVHFQVGYFSAKKDKRQ